MGLITFFLLGAFSLFYASQSFDKKPAFVTKAVDFIGGNIKYLSIFSVIYGVIAFLLSAITVDGGMEVLVVLASNALVVAFALPKAVDYAADKASDELKGELSSVFSKLDSINGWIVSQQKVLGLAGVVLTLLLFGFVFD